MKINNNKYAFSKVLSESTSASPIELPLRRPLPWLLFLPTVLMLRLFRVGLSFVSILRGNEPVGPIEMVHYLQNIRRNLRAVRFDGLREIRVHQQHRAVDTMNLMGRWMFFLGLGVARGNATEDTSDDSSVEANEASVSFTKSNP